jgi:hypothetical protein
LRRFSEKINHPFWTSCLATQHKKNTIEGDSGLDGRGEANKDVVPGDRFEAGFISLIH